MSWSDMFWSESDRLLRRFVPAETDITYQCIPVALTLALLPPVVAHAVVYIHQLQWRRQQRRRHERAAASGRGRGEGGGEGAGRTREERERGQKEQLWLKRSARSADAALASLGLFAAGVAALQAERVRPLDANAHCLVYLAYRALHTFWILSHTFDCVSPATAATPLRCWLARPACSAVLAVLATLQVVAMFYDAAARRNRFDHGGRNIWFVTI